MITGIINMDCWALPYYEAVFKLSDILVETTRWPKSQDLLLSGVTDGDRGAYAPLAAPMWPPFLKWASLIRFPLLPKQFYKLESFHLFLLLQQCFAKLCARAFLNG